MLPLVLFVVVSAGVFTLAKLHPASPATASGPVTLGDVAHGKVLFLQKCAPCHGTQAEGKVGPRLAGVALTVEEARAQIENGGGIMPAFKGKIPDSQIQAITDFIVGLGTGKPPAQ